MKKLAILIVATLLLMPQLHCAKMFNAMGMSNIGKSLEALSDTDDMQFTPPGDYVLGTIVAKHLLKDFKLYNDGSKQPIGSTEIEKYFSAIGRTLAMASDRPESFFGYRFVLLDSDHINAFAVPGGFIFFSLGVLKICQNEDELAGIVAHEINHLVEEHPTDAIATGIRKTAAADVMKEASKSVTGSAMLDNAVEKAFRSSYNGYSRDKELETDRLSVRTLVRAGYDPNGLVKVLSRLKGGYGGGHPEPSDRADAVAKVIKNYKKKGVEMPPVEQARTERFNRITAEYLNSQS